MRPTINCISPWGSNEDSASSTARRSGAAETVWRHRTRGRLLDRRPGGARARRHAIRSGDSATKATLSPIWPRALRLDPDVKDPFVPMFMQLETVARRAHEFDVIHSHLDYFGYPLLRRLGTPSITTLHAASICPSCRRFTGYTATSGGVDFQFTAHAAAGSELRRNGAARPASESAEQGRGTRRIPRFPRASFPREGAGRRDSHRGAGRHSDQDRGQGWTASIRSISRPRSSRCSSKAMSNSSARSARTKSRNSWAMPRGFCSR